MALEVKGLTTQSVLVGQTARFSVQVEGGDVTYVWKRNGHVIPGQTSAGCSFLTTAADDGAEIEVIATKGSDSGSATTELRVEDAPILYDPKLVSAASGAMVGLWLLVSGVLVAGLIWAIQGLDDRLSGMPWMVAVFLLVVGVASLLAGLFLALLEFRGRARTAEELAAAEPAGRAQVDSLADDAGGIISAIPEAIKSFGTLKTTSAFLVLAAVTFVAAAAIGWKGVEGSPTPTSTPTTTSSPSVAASPSIVSSPSP